ncbi:hypothetical protein K6L44_09935 [Gluconacetobacter entanii]|uniref:hypothetical protein n=1 Tax=Gluconacetobacter entanii TaxID=108528 RepID=UPI001C932DD5|nr:hypothetical protein [Gluconacetobacter entanii]MBY4640299.1 hypothetical protein [Gluconacetobacter entanii]MCW4579927.1 hypothetical protein [Gluconacetobacter entanii]MCW4584640.1 hypothetical protein [Gluconacetobacter entanii]MCW4588098.1 hypothetical protein [Gluconacetobacter entanii]
MPEEENIMRVHPVSLSLLCSVWTFPFGLSRRASGNYPSPNNTEPRALFKKKSGHRKKNKKRRKS